MARGTSPLRYPGGKTTLYPLVSSVLRANKLERAPYAEPYAGGCGLALALLYEGHVSDHPYQRHRSCNLGVLAQRSELQR